MVKKLTFLLVFAMILIIFFGCRHGGQGGFIAKEAERQIVSLTGTVGEDGSLAPIVFPSGAKIKADNVETFHSGVKVIVTEEKTRSTTPLNNNIPIDIYLYSVKAILYSENPLVTPVEVTTLNKPFTIILPNNISDRGRCYLGTRENENAPWHFMRVTESGNILANFVSLRASNEKAPKEVTLTLYRAGLQLALFVFNDLTETTTTAKVETTQSTADEKITTKEDKYTQDLEIISILKGTGLENLKSSDLSIKISFNSDIANLTTFKTDNKTNQLTCVSNEGSTGGKYAYSFDLKDTPFNSQMGSEIKLKYTLNTNNVNTTDFPKGFLVEFTSVTNNDKLTPFYYSEFLTFETEEEQDEPEPELEPEPQPEPVIEVFTITYNLDGGLLTVDNPTSYDITSDTITLNKPTKVGYTFIGWTGSNGNEPQTTVTIEQGSSGDKEFTANWSAVAYVITYNLDGGVVSEANPDGYNTASETFVLNEPDKIGYTFIGWTGSNGDVPQKSLSVIQGSNSDLSFTANYTPISYNIAYTLNDGILATDNPTSYDITSATINIINPTKLGYAFTGWTGTGLDSASMTLSIPQGSTEDRTYTANWSISNYRLDIVKGAGINTVTGDGMYEYNSVVNASCTMLDGYEFDSWTGDCTTETFNMPADNATMTANAKPLVYNITYDLAEGALPVGLTNPVTYDITSATITLNNPARDGYTFKGWNGTDLTGDENTIVTIPQGSIGNRDYTANYIIASYTITYDLDGGNVAVANPTGYDVTSATITLNNPSRNGYVFAGWTSDDITTPQLEMTIPHNSYGNKHFIAHWNLKLNITISKNNGSNSPENNLLYCDPSFTISYSLYSGGVMTEDIKDNILSAICVKDSEDNAVDFMSVVWKNETQVTLSFTEDLNASSTYVISVGDIDNVALMTYNPFSFKTFYFQGRGSMYSKPFKVYNLEQLNLIRNYLNKDYIQMEDLDLACYSCWLPIGNASNKFAGNYNGNNKNIYNLSIVYDSPDGNIYNDGYVGLFGRGYSADVSNLNLSNVYIMINNNNGYKVGGLIGYDDGVFSNCYVSSITVSVTSNSYNNHLFVGGICGNDVSTISSCRVENASFSCSAFEQPQYIYVGGIYGGSNTSNHNCRIYNCNAIDINISASGNWHSYIGGIYGGDWFSKTTSCNLISTSGEHKIRGNSTISDHIGGICGKTYADVQNCSVKNYKLIGDSSVVIGGVVGNLEHQYITNSYVEDTVISAQSGSLGGICGHDYVGRINNCYIKNTSINMTSGAAKNAIGGICGIRDSAGSNNAIQSCYVLNSSISSLGNNLVYIGGICGNNVHGFIESCYVKESNISCVYGYMGGIGGFLQTKNEDNKIENCYILNTSVSSSGNNTYNGGICGYVNASSTVSASYVYEDDTHNITGGRNGYIAGYIYYSISNGLGKVSDSFCNKSGTLVYSNSQLATNCYDGVNDLADFNSKTWTDGVWTASYTIDVDHWPPDLKSLPRGD